MPYEALVSACNENGCSLPAIVKTTKPQKPTMVTLIKEPTLFIANISLSNDGGMQISKIAAVLESYTANGDLVNRADSITVSDASNGYVLASLPPVESMSLPTRCIVQAATTLAVARKRLLIFLVLTMRTRQYMGNLLYSLCNKIFNLPYSRRQALVTHKLL